jgi:hypothetical protein
MITDANICNEETYVQIKASADLLQHAKEQYGGSFPTDAEIVLELPRWDESDARCYYYCINHEDQTLFWLNTKEIAAVVVGDLYNQSLLSRISIWHKHNSY